MGLRVKMMAGVFLDIKGAMGDVVFVHDRYGEVEAISRPRFRIPKRTEANAFYRKGYAICDDLWRRLVWWKRRRWFKGAWQKGYCPHSAFMAINMRRWFSDVALLEVPGKKRTIVREWAAPESVHRGYWNHCRGWNVYGWSIDEDGSNFVLGDPRGYYNQKLEGWAQEVWEDAWQEPDEPVELLTFRTFIRTSEGFMLNQEGEDGIYIPISISGVSVMIDGWLVAYRGDSDEGYECIQPCGPIDIEKQSWHDIIISLYIGPKQYMEAKILWEGMSFFEWVEKHKVEWWGGIIGKGTGLFSDWPNYMLGTDYAEIAGKTVYGASAGWATGGRGLGNFPEADYGDEVPLEKVETSDDVRFGFTVETLAAVELRAASAVKKTGARLNGEVVYTGLFNPEITMYWGAWDGEQEPGNWEHSSEPTDPGQPQEQGPFYLDIFDLVPGTEYFFSCSAFNISGTSWPASSLSFTTDEGWLFDLFATSAVGWMCKDHEDHWHWTVWEREHMHLLWDSDDDRMCDYSGEEGWRPRTVFNVAGGLKPGEVVEIAWQFEGHADKGLEPVGLVLNGYIFNWSSEKWESLFSISGVSDKVRWKIIDENCGDYVSENKALRFSVVGPTYSGEGDPPWVRSDVFRVLLVK